MYQQATPATHPLPPNRRTDKIILTDKVKVDAVCTNCRKKPGKLTCSRCSAVNFCSAECQKVMWKKHKPSCNKVKQLVEEIHDHIASNAFHQYLRRRSDLAMVYFVIARRSLSKTAFRLGVENYMIAWSLGVAKGGHPWPPIGWMLAGDMDQEALFYILTQYNQMCCETEEERLPVLDTESEHGFARLCETIYSTILARSELPQRFRVQIVMFLAMLGIKRYQRSYMEVLTSMAKWKSFLMGTHPVIGENSPIQLLRGNSLVLDKIMKLVLSRPCQGMEDEMVVGPRKIEEQLDFVHKRHEHMIPMLLDPAESIPDDRDEPMWSIFDTPSMHGEEWVWLSEDPKTQPTGSAYIKMCPVLHIMLGNFLKTGKISGADEPVEHPVGGLYQTAIDIDPTKAFGDCSEFSLICLKSKTSVHSCT